MTARNKNDLRSLIEEARESINEHDCNDTVDTELSRATTFLDQALALLPEWQEFDPEREETWPKKSGQWIVLSQFGKIRMAYWERGDDRAEFISAIGHSVEVVRYHAIPALPPPYHPKEDVEIKP